MPAQRPHPESYVVLYPQQILHSMALMFLCLQFRTGLGGDREVYTIKNDDETMCRQAHTQTDTQTQTHTHTHT